MSVPRLQGRIAGHTAAALLNFETLHNPDGEAPSIIGSTLTEAPRPIVPPTPVTVSTAADAPGAATNTLPVTVSAEVPKEQIRTLADLKNAAIGVAEGVLPVSEPASVGQPSVGQREAIDENPFDFPSQQFETVPSWLKVGETSPSEKSDKEVAALEDVDLS
eukprot:1190608-Prorocentrum_minimum.AAC.1